LELKCHEDKNEFKNFNWRFFWKVIVLLFLGMLRRCLQLPSKIPNLLTAPPPKEKGGKRISTYRAGDSFSHQLGK